MACYADEQGRAVVEVADTGIGILEELRKQIFDPFFTTKDIGVGTGLGLFVSHAIVSAIGGVIEVESHPGEGSVFRVRLPAATHALAQTGPSTNPPAPLPARDTPGGRVLVIDDDEFVARVLRRVLVRDHEVIVLGGGHDAIARLDKPIDKERLRAVVRGVIAAVKR